MKIGLLAGSGNLPLEFLKSTSQKGNETVLFAIRGITDNEVYSFADKVYEIEPFKLGKFLSFVKKERPDKMAILGKVEHSEALSLKNLDIKAVTFLFSLKDKRAEAIIGGIIKEIEKLDVEVIDPTPFLSHLLPERGILTGKVNRDLEKDVEFGFRIAKEIASLDVGQTVVVKNGVVIAVEGIEGTDKCIERAAELAGKGFVVCKAARKGQDMRIDVPTIGVNTVEKIGSLGGRALCVEAGKTFILDRNELIRKARKFGVTVIAV
ncbi:UDP-2,3-diacylglucosamine diphosphatase LpxI [Desulfurobacterium sp.]|uniref:LpxI family protein n=1 Tax=Desulfurobacterium sp. TaxID=2004706 RepID=UPI0026176296|nr:UDP-2,3-diacylglucosamine diphosphatase LpxI [Desulfurobacterium sp.]